MKNSILKRLPIFLLIVTMIVSCRKSFLEKKPSTELLQPKTLADFQLLLENNSTNNVTSGLPQMASDEYFIKSQADFDNINTAVQRNASIWAQEFYEGAKGIVDWNKPFQAIFYANSVIEGLSKLTVDSASKKLYNNLLGWAYFLRAYAMYDLARNFAPAYDSVTAGIDLGIPIRLSPNIDELVHRSSVKQTYDQIFSDLRTASPLLDVIVQPNNRNRPSRPAAYALFARVNLAMRNYTDALKYSDSCLSLYNTLINYNAPPVGTVSATSLTPFSFNAPEVLYSTIQVVAHTDLTGTSGIRLFRIDSNLIKTYHPRDLRKSIFFQWNNTGTNADNYYVMKRGYISAGNFAFTGLATDEIYLIKAECLARAGNTGAAIDVVNTLYKMRWSTAAPLVTFVGLSAANADEALTKILLERRKELVWRGLRWEDIKRLNKEGANIIPTRNIGGTIYTIQPNSPRYVFPIPDDEIALSGILQNPR